MKARKLTLDLRRLGETVKSRHYLRTGGMLDLYDLTNHQE